MGPGAGPHSAGTRGKFVCLHSPLQFLETPSVHPERMSHSCFPGWSALLSVSLKGHTGSKHPVLPDCPLWGQEPWAGAGGPGAGDWGQAHPGCTGPPGPLAAGPRPLPSRRAGPRRWGARQADRQLWLVVCGRVGESCLNGHFPESGFFSGEELGAPGSRFSTLRLLCADAGHAVANPSPSGQSVSPCWRR